MEAIEIVARKIVKILRKSEHKKGIIREIKENYPLIQKKELEKSYCIISQCIDVIQFISHHFPEGKLNKNIICKKLGYKSSNIAFLIAFDTISKERIHCKEIAFFIRSDQGNTNVFLEDISTRLKVIAEET